MKKLFVYAMAALAMVACTSKKAADNADAAQAEATEVEALSFVGSWHLIDFAGDSAICEVDSADNYVLTIAEADSAFNLTTDCNAIGGKFVINGDSIKFDNLFSTKMACPNEEVERTMSTILPMIDTYAITPDSTLLLRSDMRTMARFAYER